ncbi:MAG: pyridoxamine 5'-phosphate oxidase family protein [Bacteroidales bacterium]|jgi:nitroimidazol reductase NimA-like FMN-containing flavoprotein (pyridoxamine 5'-phosphate oxidase superfamily)|nr:pyridoxamine 5'-phosphate oxidase family protein [Bacteroidales bacterium]
MVKRDKAIKDIVELDKLEEIIGKCKICRVGMVDVDTPYVLAMNFGYDNQAIWLHCAKEGKKVDILKRNNKVCIEFDTDHKLFSRHEHVACSWRYAYRSVLIHGNALFVEDYNEKIKGLNIFMKNYSGKEFEYSKPSVDNIYLIKIPIDSITGRSFEY